MRAGVVLPPGYTTETCEIIRRRITFMGLAAITAAQGVRVNLL